MHFKNVRVLDDATEVFFLIGKSESTDNEMMEATGWGTQSVTLLINIKKGGGVQGCMSTFKGYIPYDLEVYGPLSVSGTTIKLAKIVRDLTLEEIPDVLDVRKY